MIYNAFKVLHLLGLALFLGSIFGHIVSSALGGEVGGTLAFQMARAHIAFATSVLTMPGLYLSLLSGVAMVLAGRLSPLRERWLFLHGGLAIAILLLALCIIQPAVAQVLLGAQELVRGAGSLQAVTSAKHIEDAVGGANVVLALVAIGVAVWKPRFGRP
jgi:hypothetical protein